MLQVLLFLFQKPACAAARSARLPRAVHILTYSVSGSPCPVGRPHPPPPGVSIRSRSPLPMLIVAFPPTLISRIDGESPARASPSSSRACLIQVLRPSAPGEPPSRPYGPRVRRYENKSDLVLYVDYGPSPVPQIRSTPAKALKTQVLGSRLRPLRIFLPQQSPDGVQRYARALGIVAQVARHRRSVCWLCVCAPLTFHAKSGLPQNLPQSSTWPFSIHKGVCIYRATHLVITPSCDIATFTIFTTRPKGEIVRAPLTGCACMKCSQYNVHNAL